MVIGIHKCSKRAPRMFCGESLGKINAKDVELFRNGSVVLDHNGLV